nr:hypothetical protein [Clostridia bacterium]
MKKIVALLMLVAMMLTTVAFAEPTLLADFGDENTLVYAREIAYVEGTVDALGNAANTPGCPTGYAHVTAWAGEWQLVAAYVAEAGIEEFELEGVEAGYYAVSEGVILNLIPLFNASANHANGVMADQAAYLHAHAYDLEGTLTMPEAIDDAFQFSADFKAWEYGTVRTENDADMNFGPIKVSFKKGDDDFLYWNALTGFNFEEIEEFKYIGMNANGQIVVCSASKNVVTSEKAEIYFAYIFEPVVAEEVAE